MDKLQEIRKWRDETLAAHPLFSTDVRIEHISYLLETVERLQQRNTTLREALEKSDAENERIHKRNWEICEQSNERVGSMVKGLQAIVAYPKGEALVYVSEIKAIAATTLSTIEGGKASE